ncbi:MAG TPA: Asp-tRNA(Asn)/Glu-tRNA(Gln) amidotransferase subunit GatC [Patescibacteria group bacterium]|nr:Asp-tRNA(Asn)/Glu-tRNA(Gln) amidotransferase subunit GatC [Patescibacteria group bacterium]
MAKLTKNDVLKLAQLARLKLTNEEIDLFSKELSEILTYVEKLSKIDSGNLKPTNQVSGLSNVTREDKVKSYGYKPQDLLNNVPQVKNNQIKAKRMIY